MMRAGAHSVVGPMPDAADDAVMNMGVGATGRMRGAEDGKAGFLGHDTTPSPYGPGVCGSILLYSGFQILNAYSRASTRSLTKLDRRDAEKSARSRCSS